MPILERGASPEHQCVENTGVRTPSSTHKITSKTYLCVVGVNILIILPFKILQMTEANKTVASNSPTPIAVSTTAETEGLRTVETTESHQVQLTEYQDAAQTLSDASPGVTPDSLWEGSSPLPDQGLKAVLSRSYQLGVYTWTSSAVGTDIVANMDVLATLLAVPNIAEKVAYFKYFRCKGVNLTLRVNSTPWHYGALIASSTVNDSYEFHNSSVPQSRQYMNNRPVVIDAASMDAVNYEIHWKSARQWYDVKDALPAHLMTFRLTVGAPLSMIGTALNNARVTIFANFIDPEVALPMADSIALVRAQSGVLDPFPGNVADELTPAQLTRRLGSYLSLEPDPFVFAKEIKRDPAAVAVMLTRHLSTHDLGKICEEIALANGVEAGGLIQSKLFQSNPQDVMKIVQKHLEGVDNPYAYCNRLVGAHACAADLLVKRLARSDIASLLTKLVDKHGYIVEAQSGRKKASKEARDKSESGSIISDIRSFADTTFQIVGSAADVAAKIAPMVAFMADKPTTLRPMDHVSVLPGVDMPYFHGLDSSVKLSGLPDASAGFSAGVLGESIGNPSIYSLVRTPGYIGNWTFTSGTAAGTKVFERGLSVVGQAYKTGNTLTVTPLTWYSSLFKFWRGGIKFFFHFVTSSFITARLRFVWIPPDHSAPATIADNESGDYVSQVVEVTGSMNHCVTIPYINSRLYKRVTGGTTASTLSDVVDGTSNLENVSLGTLAVYLVTPVVTVDSAITPTVNAITWISGAEDMQFSNMSGELAQPQGETWEFGTVTAQCSIFEEFSKPFEPIIDANFAFECGLATSEDYGDIASLMKRYSVSVLTGTGTNDYSDGFNWNAFQLPSGANTVANFQQWITACFVNFRGSVRFKAFWPTANASASTLPTVVGAHTPADVLEIIHAPSNPTFVTTNTSNNYFEFEIVWNTRQPFLNRGLNQYTEGLGVHVLLPVVAPAPQPVGTYAMSVGDDFALGVYQAPPLVTITPAPPLVPAIMAGGVHKNQ